MYRLRMQWWNLLLMLSRNYVDLNLTMWLLQPIIKIKIYPRQPPGLQEQMQPGLPLEQPRHVNMDPQEQAHHSAPPRPTSFGGGLNDCKGMLADSPPPERQGRYPRNGATQAPFGDARLEGRSQVTDLNILYKHNPQLEVSYWPSCEDEGPRRKK